MTELLAKAMATVGNLPPEAQDDIARVILTLSGGDDSVIELTAAEHADLVEAQAEMERGEFATDDEVQAVFAKYRA